MTPISGMMKFYVIPDRGANWGVLPVGLNWEKRFILL